MTSGKFPSLNLGFLISKTIIIIIPTSLVVVKLKCNDVFKVLKYSNLYTLFWSYIRHIIIIIMINNLEEVPSDLSLCQWMLWMRRMKPQLSNSKFYTSSYKFAQASPYISVIYILPHG